MILLAGVLVLAAVALLVLGLTQGSPTLQWASFAASALAAVVVVGGEVRRHLAARGAPTAAGTAGEERAPAAARPARPPERQDQPRRGASGHRPPSQEQPGQAPPGSVPPSSVPPSSEPPTYAPPAIEPPSYQPPTYAPPANEPPSYQPPSYEPPSYRPAGYEPPTYAPPAHEPTSHGLSGEDPTAVVPAAAVPAAGGAPTADGADGEPPVEEVEMTDLLVVMDLADEVLVVDEHPRYHLPGCPHLAGQDTFPLPMVEARTDGFTPCGTCAPDRNLARVERARRSR